MHDDDKGWTALDCLLTIRDLFKVTLPESRTALSLANRDISENAIELRVGGRVFRVRVEDLGPTRDQPHAAFAAVGPTARDPQTSFRHLTSMV